MEIDLEHGKIDIENVQQSVQSWFAHLDHADTWKLRQAILNQYKILRELEL